MNSVTQNTTISNEVVAVKFYDDTLITLEKEGEHYVAVRPIVENMGLDWTTQAQKLKSPKFSCGHIPTTGKDGKTYNMLCIPVKKLNGWLFSINPEKVRADIRPIVEQYQEECFTVLHDYWHKGVAVNERAATTPTLSTVKDRNGLVKTCEWFVRVASYLGYDEVWNLVHHRFNINRACELTTEQVGQATEYLQGLLLQVIAQRRGFNPQTPLPLPLMHRADVGKYDNDGVLWTRVLEPDEQIVRTKDIPQLIINEPYIDNETLTAINYASSVRLASMLKNPPFLTTLDNAKEV
jgi:hypothetical protein